MLNCIRKDAGKRSSQLAVICLAMGLTWGTGCSTDNTPAAPGGDRDSGAEPGPVDPFTGDCSTARWGNVSPACWNCFCNRCKPQLDLCGEDCLGLLKCGSQESTGKASELSCEARGFIHNCLTSATQSGLTEVLDFDLCLIAAHDSTEQLRSCEKECGMKYVDDICERYPEPDAG